MKPPIGSYLAAIGAGVMVLAGLTFLSLGAPDIPAALVAVAALIVAAMLGVAAFRLRVLTLELTRRADRAELELGGLKAMVEAVPDPWIAWGSDGTQAASPRLPALLGLDRVRRLEDVETALEPGDAAALHGCFRHLQETGLPFLLNVRTLPATGGATGRALQVAGGRGLSETGERFDVLWLRDISTMAADTARLSAERERLSAERARFAAALGRVPYPVWLRGSDLNIRWCNPAFARLLDAAPDAVVEDGLELPGGGLSDAPRVLAQRALDENTAQTDTRYLVLEGDRRLFRLMEIPMPGRELLGVAIDVTAEREVADELERHISAHREVLEQLASAIAIFGPDQRLRFHNHAYARLWELDEGWLATEPSFGEVLEDLRARRKLTEQVDFSRWKKQQLAKFTALIEPEEDLLHLPDGRTLRALGVPHPFGGLMFVMEDVTHALALESSYNTLIAVQQETLDNLAEGVAVFGGDGRLRLHNPAFARIWSLAPDELVGEPHVTTVMERLRHMLDMGDDWTDRRDRMVGTMLERKARTGQLERADGAVIQFSQVPLPDGAVLLSVLDVTDSVRVEQALRERNEALETTDRLKSEFIANVSYQLRTPLNAIMGFAEILNNQYFGALNDRQLEYARGVLEASRRLLTLVNDILDLATIEAGFMTLDRSRFDVGGLLQSVAGLTRDWARKQSLEIDLELGPELGFMDGDEKRLKQALFNLVSNAVKFTPPGGRITLSGRRNGDGVELSVSDTGIGIPTDDRQRVFNRFERARNAARHSGAGLGLSLVKSFVELHGGKVELQSALDQGTRVVCYLPVTGPREARAAVAE